MPSARDQQLPVSGRTLRGRRVALLAAGALVVVATASLTFTAVATGTEVTGPKPPTDRELARLRTLGVSVPAGLRPFSFQPVVDRMGERSTLSVISGPGRYEYTLVARRPLFTTLVSLCRLDTFNDRRAICFTNDNRYPHVLLRDLDDTLLLSLRAGSGSPDFVWVDAGSGNDSITTGATEDLLEGSTGNDVLSAGANDDHLFGGLGDDLLLGGDGNDTIDGGDGNDRIEGGNGNDRLSGGNGDDRINGGGGDNTIGGGDGNDLIEGSGRRDLISGGSGNDVIDPGAGPDGVSGGDGDDVIRARDTDMDVVICGAGTDIVYFDVGIDSVSRDCEIRNP